MHRLANTDEEIGTSRVTARLGIQMCPSSYTITAFEELLAKSRVNPYLIRMCIVKDRDIMLQSVQRVEAADTDLSFYQSIAQHWEGGRMK
jgi:(S)-2-hydroxy-acid oxidase